jgi:hypothetical protein
LESRLRCWFSIVDVSDFDSGWNREYRQVVGECKSGVWCVMLRTGKEEEVMLTFYAIRLAVRKLYAASQAAQSSS